MEGSDTYSHLFLEGSDTCSHKQVPPKYRPEYQLVNVVDDRSFKFFLIGWERCTIVSADVVLLGPEHQVAPPEPGEAGNGGPIPGQVTTERGGGVP